MTDEDKRVARRFADSLAEAEGKPTRDPDKWETRADQQHESAIATNKAIEADHAGAAAARPGELARADRYEAMENARHAAYLADVKSAAEYRVKEVEALVRIASALETMALKA